jgi:hypothetical protein
MMTMNSNEYFVMKAGKVWEALCEGPRSMTQLQEETGLANKDICMGLGWLAREGKIRPIDHETGKAMFQLIG